MTFEESAELRHEYVGGRLFAMVGASEADNKVAGSLLRRLYEHVEDASESTEFAPIGWIYGWVTWC